MKALVLPLPGGFAWLACDRLDPERGHVGDQLPFDAAPRGGNRRVIVGKKPQWYPVGLNTLLD